MKGRIVLMGERDITISFQEEHKYKLDESVDVVRVKNKRSRMQNAMYWALLDWAIENGGKSRGHFSANGLHENCKTAYAEHLRKPEFSTAELSSLTMYDYLQWIGQTFLPEMLGVQTYGFFDDYDRWQAWKQETGEDSTFREWKSLTN